MRDHDTLAVAEFGVKRYEIVYFHYGIDIQMQFIQPNGTMRADSKLLINREELRGLIEALEQAEEKLR